MTELDWDALRETTARRQFQLHSTGSIGWLIYAQQLYRASQVLCETARKANEQSIQAFLQEIEKDRINTDPNKATSSSRKLTLEEQRENVDASLELPAFYFLARAIEVLLKAVMIARQEDYFLKPGKKILDKKKLNHDINFYIKECGIALNEAEQKQIALLNQVNTWGTYPIPVDEKTLINITQLRYRSEYPLNLNTYPQVALLYDKILNTWNEERTKENKGIWLNIFKPQDT